MRERSGIQLSAMRAPLRKMPVQNRDEAIVVPDNVLFEGGAGECLRESAFKIQGDKLA